MERLIQINGNVNIPYPSEGLELIVSTLVDSGRNARGEVVGQRVGRDNYKCNSLQWNWLDAKTWSMILKEFENFFVICRIPDMVNNDWIELKMYPGDRSAKPYWLDKKTGLPSHYQNCKVNIIDCGVIGK